MVPLSVNDDGRDIENKNNFGNGLKNIQKRMLEINGEVALLPRGHMALVSKVHFHNILIWE